jgi:MFS transporter, ACS family, D-galactonate transporter
MACGPLAWWYVRNSSREHPMVSEPEARRIEEAHAAEDAQNTGDDDVGAKVLDARDRCYEVDCGAKGPNVSLHLCVDRRHSAIESVDLIDIKAQQEAMVLRDPGASKP